MTSFFPSLLWPAVANHLWQSTLFAVVAALLTLLLRKHGARTRHWLWLAASLKFLVPFSLLVKLGSYLSWPHASVQSSTPALYSAIEDISQPFTEGSANVNLARPVHSIVSSGLPHISEIVAAIWLAGFLAVLILWTLRWFRITSATRKAEPLSHGREVFALRRIERIFGLRIPIGFLQSRASLEPGIFGILRPVLIWPEGISRHLNDSQLESVLAHEVWHVRRRDNLFAALHMLVEAVFWFYPLVWWIGARLIDERERACDEEVVALGNDRQVYAESILKVCEFCLGSPLPCVSGVTGADLKQRMVHIMNDRILHKLDFARKLLLTTAAALAIATPVLFGAFHATPLRAESPAATVASDTPLIDSVSIKPHPSSSNGAMKTKMMFSLTDGSFVAEGVSLRTLIETAYRIQDTQLSGGPDWINTALWDIQAKLSNFAPKAELGKTGPAQPGPADQALLQALLSQSFKLALHPETRNVSAFDLLVAEGGSKLQQQSGEMRRVRLGRGELTSEGAPLDLLVNQLSMRLGRTVVDKTGLKGNYSFNLRWTPAAEEAERLKQQGFPQGGGMPSPSEASGPDLLTAVQQQLGLKLEPATDNVQVLVIDHAEQPSD